MNTFAYYNGTFGKREEIFIPLADRSIFFGDAIYDAAIGSYDRILWEYEHITRLFTNAKRIGINHTYTKATISALLREIAVKSMLSSYFIYFQLSRGANKRVHSATDCEANLLITIEPITIDVNQKPLKLITTEDLRYRYCDIKTVNLLPAVLASTDAEIAGADEAVFIKNGHVTECAKSNISIIKQGRLITHPNNSEILPGITRAHLLAVCRNIKMGIEERPFSKEELFNADEILVTSTTKLCRRVSEIDGVIVGGKASVLAEKICQMMYQEYEDFCLK